MTNEEYEEAFASIEKSLKESKEGGRMGLQEDTMMNQLDAIYHYPYHMDSVINSFADLKRLDYWTNVAVAYKMQYTHKRKLTKEEEEECWKLFGRGLKKEERKRLDTRVAYFMEKVDSEIRVLEGQIYSSLRAFDNHFISYARDRFYKEVEQRIFEMEMEDDDIPPRLFTERVLANNG